MLRRVDTQAIELPQLAGGELVANEQLVGDRLHSSALEQHGTAPPSLRIENRRLGVDLRIEI